MSQNDIIAHLSPSKIEDDNALALPGFNIIRTKCGLFPLEKHEFWEMKNLFHFDSRGLKFSGFVNWFALGTAKSSIWAAKAFEKMGFPLRFFFDFSSRDILFKKVLEQISPTKRLSHSSDCTLTNKGSEVENKLFDLILLVGRDNIYANSGGDECNVKSFSFQSRILDHYPEAQDAKLPLYEELAGYAFPKGVLLECGSSPPPSFFYSMLTTANGNHLYTTCIQFYERITPFELLKVFLDSKNECSLSVGGNLEDKSSGTSSISTPLFINKRSLNPTHEPKKSSSFIPKFLNHHLGKHNNSSSFWSPKCLMLLSHFPLYDSSKMILASLLRIRESFAPLPLHRFIENIFDIPIPKPGIDHIQFSIGDETVFFYQQPTSEPNHLDIPLKRLFEKVSTTNIFQVLVALLCGERVIVLGSFLSSVTIAVEALRSLLFPLEWVGTCLHILPFHLIELTSSPVSFLLGILRDHFSEFTHNRNDEYLEREQLILLDIDKDTLHVCATRFPPKVPEKQQKLLLQNWEDAVARDFEKNKCLLKSLADLTKSVDIYNATLKINTQSSNDCVDQFSEKLLSHNLEEDDLPFKEPWVLVCEACSSAISTISDNVKLINTLEKLSCGLIEICESNSLSLNVNLIGQPIPVKQWIFLSGLRLKNEQVYAKKSENCFSNKIRKAMMNFICSTLRNFEDYLVVKKGEPAQCHINSDGLPRGTLFRTVLDTQMAEQFAQQFLTNPAPCGVQAFKRWREQKRRKSFKDATYSELFIVRPPNCYGLPFAKHYPAPSFESFSKTHVSLSIRDICRNIIYECAGLSSLH
eukprot:TRINITY_DN1768_c0_g1_i5.p1 TRINITY_DN1768_c0_g1~~TRINITY_DN1768_c0_g1_i5.p1  ORF type:complete len:868 (-),score=56.94 TRINITY_DN1768_c0_g1_i5:695-3121(-)